MAEAEEAIIRALADEMFALKDPNRTVIAKVAYIKGALPFAYALPETEA